MALETPLILQPTTGDTLPNGGYTGAQLRGIFDALAPLPGVSKKNDCLVAPRAAGANMSVDVAAGQCAITGTSVTYQGTYLCRSTATVNVTLAAAPGAGARYDLIVAKVFDKQADGGTQYAWTPMAVQGVLNAGVPPAVPVNAIPLAQVRVNANVTSIDSTVITDLRLLNTLVDVPLWQRTGGNGQAIPNTTNTVYSGWTFSDLIGMDTVGGSPGDVIARQAGRYLTSFSVRISNGGTVTTEKAIYIEQVRAGSTIRRVASVGVIPSAMQSVGMPLTCTGTARCNAGDTLRAVMYQASGVQLNITDAFTEASFTGVWVGP